MQVIDFSKETFNKKRAGYWHLESTLLLLDKDETGLTYNVWVAYTHTRL